MMRAVFEDVPAGLFFHHLGDGVPKFQAGFQGGGGGLLGGLPVVGVLAAEGFDEAGGHGAVVVAVEVDVALQVVLERIELVAGGAGQFVDDLLKQFRQQRLAAESEGGGDAAGIVRIDDGEGVLDKVFY